MYDFAKNQTPSLVEIELSLSKTGLILPKSIEICDNLLQKFRFTFGQPKPLFCPKPKFHRSPETDISVHHYKRGVLPIAYDEHVGTKLDGDVD